MKTHAVQQNKSLPEFHISLGNSPKAQLETDHLQSLQSVDLEV